MSSNASPRAVRHVWWHGATAVATLGSSFAGSSASAQAGVSGSEAGFEVHRMQSKILATFAEAVRDIPTGASILGYAHGAPTDHPARRNR